MKKQKNTWLLILVVCVFYSSIPTTVFGQGAPLGQEVYNDYRATLQRAELRAALPAILFALRNPDVRALLTSENIDVILANPDLLTPELVTRLNTVVGDSFITFLRDDTDIRDMLGDQDVKDLLQDIVAIETLAGLLSIETTVRMLDAALANAVRNRLGLTPADPITNVNILALRRLGATYSNIRDLTGLEHATNLRRLWLFNNRSVMCVHWQS